MPRSRSLWPEIFITATCLLVCGYITFIWHP